MFLKSPFCMPVSAIVFCRQNPFFFLLFSKAVRAIIKAENRRILFQWPIKTKKQGAGVFMGKKSWERLCEEREFNAFYQALAQQSGFEQIGRFLQHGSTTRLMHSVAVAYYSYRLAKITRLSFLFTGKKWCGGLCFTITFFTTPRMETPHTSGIGPVTPGSPQKTRNVKCHSPRLKRTQSAAICFLSQ